MRVPKNILITGGCGFIGSNLIHYLFSAYPNDKKVVNVDCLTYAGNRNNLKEIEKDPRYKYYQNNICDTEKMIQIISENEIDTIFHLAANSHVDRSISAPSEFIQTNIVGTFSLLEAIREVWKVQENKIFVGISTDEVYGSLGPVGSFTEDTAYNPRSPYSAAKAAADHLVSAYYHTYNLPTIVTNCSNNYGPYQFPEKLIPVIITAAVAQKTIPVYGDGHNIRDWLHVEDHCRALIQVATRGIIGRSYNIGGASEISNINLVKMILSKLSAYTGVLEGDLTSLIKFVEDRKGHDQRYAINFSRIRRELGWAPIIPFKKGLESTIFWYLQNQSWIDEINNRGNV